MGIPREKPRILPGPKEATASPDFFSSQVIAASRFFRNLERDDRKRLSIASGGFERCSPDYLINRSTFPYLSIEYVVGGRGVLELNHERWDIEPGLVYTYGPGVPHVIEADPENPPLKYFINFSGRGALALLKRCNLAPGSMRQVATGTDFRQLFDSFVLDGIQGGPLASDLCATLLEYMLLRIAASLIPGEKKSTLGYATYLKCRDHIEQHFVRLRSLQEIAKETHVDRAYLCHLFQRHDMQTPYQMLIRLKMNHAAGLLQDPQLSVKEVSASLGYLNAFHFSRIFKSTYGVSPKSFRCHGA
jgi:AraC-like DNA-binding protein